MSITRLTSPTGKVRYQVRYRNPEGRQVKQTFDTKRRAEAFEDSELTRVRQGDWIDPMKGTIPFSEWAYTWLESNPAKRESSYARDETIIRVHLIPAFGKAQLARITPLAVQHAVSQWSMKYKPRTVRRHYLTLASIFHTAVNCDLVGRTPCRGIKLPRPTKAEVRILSAEDLPRLAEAVGETGLMVYFGAMLGLRWGEVAGLQVKNFNLLERTVEITSAVGRNKHGQAILTPPKTDAAARVIAMPKSLSEMVAHHLAEMGVNATNADRLLFSTGTGRPLSYGRWRSRKWVPACESTKLKGLKFHDLRRSNATMMVTSGIDIRTAQHRLGHTDPRMTLAIYAQATRGADQQAAAQLDELFIRQA